MGFCPFLDLVCFLLASLGPPNVAVPQSCVLVSLYFLPSVSHFLYGFSCLLYASDPT